jgi:hypothetical protein
LPGPQEPFPGHHLCFLRAQLGQQQQPHLFALEHLRDDSRFPILLEVSYYRILTRELLTLML